LLLLIALAFCNTKEIANYAFALDINKKSWYNLSSLLPDDGEKEKCP